MNDEAKNTLAGISEADYGPHYREHILSIYSMYLDMADRISSRREKANSFFLALNTAVVGFVGYLIGTDNINPNNSWLALIATAGVVLSYLWYRIIRSYRGLNTAKFKVIHEIENMLPLRPYDAEWQAVGRGKDPKRYLPFTHVEILVPLVFIILHGIVMLRIVPWIRFYGCFGST